MNERMKCLTLNKSKDSVYFEVELLIIPTVSIAPDLQPYIGPRLCDDEEDVAEEKSDKDTQSSRLNVCPDNMPLYL